MKLWLATQAVFLARIAVAACCGGAIGYERQNRFKTAGIRTHIIVSIAAALMMELSKYGFSDVLGRQGVSLDPSRIAAGVVSAIGFLGAGIIFVHNQTVSGVTTAAGIWATVGIGMAIGAGMYLIGIVTTILIVMLQFLLHKQLPILKNPVQKKLVFRTQPGEDFHTDYLSKLEARHVDIESTHLHRSADGGMEVELYVRIPDSCSPAELLRLLMEDPAIQSAEL